MTTRGTTTGRGLILLTLTALVAGGSVALAPAASADHSAIELVSTGPTDDGGNGNAELDTITPDGSHAFFWSEQSLVAGDIDEGFGDLYGRWGGVTRLLTDGLPDDASFELEAVSADGSHVVFSTDAPLDAADTDELRDVYDRVGDQTHLVSTGPGDTGSFVADFGALSADGSRVVFSSEEPLTDDDDDGEIDVFAREAGVTTLVSFDPTEPTTGSSTSSASFQGASADAEVVAFELADQLSDDDADAEYDLYLRSGDDVSLVTGVPGVVSTELLFQSLDVSTDGSRVLFQTEESLVAADGDSTTDLYLYENGALRLVTADTAEPVFPEAWNPTLSAVVFASGDALVPQDDDTEYDLYLYRAGGPLSLVTSTTSGSISSLEGRFVSGDGTRVVFGSLTPLTPGEADDNASDLYLWSAGQLHLLTGGAAEEEAVFLDASSDASRVFFGTFEALLPTDTDASRDIYEATAAGISQVSRGNADEGAFFAGSSADGSRVFWETAEPVLAQDTDEADDVYVSRIAAPKNLTPPTISGKPAPGQTLTCNPGTWSDAESFAYRWNRDGAPISGATSTTYAVPAGDAGHSLTCTVTATGDGGSASATSAAVTVVKPTPTGPLPGPCANAAVGTAGADVLRGTELGDLLLGLAGRDRLIGLVDSDCLVGGPGRDRLAGGPGPDKLQGGKSADRMHGGKGRDKVHGGQGRDLLVGGQGKDRLVAGPGDDLVHALDGKADLVRCGAGDDVAVVDAKDRVSGCEDVRVR